MRERLLNTLPAFILLCLAFVLFGCTILDVNSYSVAEASDEVSNEEAVVWYPWMVDEQGLWQIIPEVEGTSHEKFKKLCQAYWLDASLIRELENKYNLREWILLAILIAETIGWNNWNYVDEGCYNLWNVGNNDRWNRVCFEWKEQSIEQVAITLNNRFLWKTITLGCLSNAGSCQWRDDWWYRYATSNGNRERTIKRVMDRIYAEDLWEEVDPSRFVVKRVSFQ